MSVGPYYEFDSCRIEPAGQVAFRGGDVVSLSASEFAILLRLIEKRGATVKKQELLALIKEKEATQVKDETATKYVSNIRLKLEDSSRPYKYIRSFSGRGYRFIYDDVKAVGFVRTIGIEPFRVISNAEDELKLGSLVAELLSTSLVNLKDFRLIPGKEYGAFSKSDALEVAPDFVISGSVTPMGRKMIVIFHLKPRDLAHSPCSKMLSETNANTLRALETICAEASALLMEKLNGYARAKGGMSDRSLHTKSTEALKSFEEGWAFLNRRTPDALVEALEHFKKATRNDPRFAEAYAGIADCNLLLAIFGSEVIRPRKAMPRAKKAALKALEIDETLSEAHASLASVMFLYERDWNGSEMEFKEAIRNNPEYATARQFYSHNLALMGRIDDALEQIRTAQELRTSPIIDATVSRIYFLGRQYEKAIEAAEYAIKRYRQFFLGYVHLGIAYKKLGRLPEAIEQLTKARELGGTTEWGNPTTVGELGHAFAVAGRTKEANETIEDLEAMSARHYVGPINLAKIYMGMGNLKRTFELLEETYRDRSAWLLTLRQDPLFDDIREQPQFQDLLRRIGLP
jgi:tetratricopeptide (TPR) repeat protein/DNA-binding winged helix-turn-helix (wHTH) protein